mmetsp:Transcript_17994/g.55852  ORF Transcript_17994/g.55852 Transcript_17994/m.55852 type:complete len:427 (+) Transcript_17994:2471-3751(+)
MTARKGSAVSFGATSPSGSPSRVACSARLKKPSSSTMPSRWRRDSCTSKPARSKKWPTGSSNIMTSSSSTIEPAAVSTSTTEPWSEVGRTTRDTACTRNHASAPSALEAWMYRSSLKAAVGRRLESTCGVSACSTRTGVPVSRSSITPDSSRTVSTEATLITVSLSPATCMVPSADAVVSLDSSTTATVMPEMASSSSMTPMASHTTIFDSRRVESLAAVYISAARPSSLESMYSSPDVSKAFSFSRSMWGKIASGMAPSPVRVPSLGPRARSYSEMALASSVACTIPSPSTSRCDSFLRSCSGTCASWSFDRPTGCGLEGLPATHGARYYRPANALLDATNRFPPAADTLFFRRRLPARAPPANPPAQCAERCFASPATAQPRAGGGDAARGTRARVKAFCAIAAPRRHTPTASLPPRLVEEHLG